MDTLFLKILNRSITASWLILALVLLRPLLKKAPKWLTCLLWSLAGLRLLFPFSIQSVLSLIPSARTVRPEILFDPTPQIQSGIPAFNQWVNPVIGEVLAPVPTASVNPLQVWTRVAAYVWLIGLFILLFYALLSYGRLRKRVGASIRLEDGSWISDEIDSPFILGLVKPRIYLPSGMEAGQRALVLAHERAHLARRDHWWKPLGFLILSLYWFNPLSWLAYILLCRDIEMACDEKVIRAMNREDRLFYSEILLASSIPHRSVMACPLAFGELAVKERIRKVLNYKKPAFWIIFLALIVSLVLVICFLTNPRETVAEPGPAEEWFDYLHSNGMEWESRLETGRPEFPGVTFRWTPGEVKALTQAGSETLFQGMPIWNSYFCDLTGDGKPELCATVSFGSGFIDNHVVVFDYENREIHYLWNRFVNDYELYLEKDRLYVAKRPPMGEEILESGRLIFQDGRPAMEGETDPPPPYEPEEKIGIGFQSFSSPVGYSQAGFKALLDRSDYDLFPIVDAVHGLIPLVKLDSRSDFEAFYREMAIHFDFNLEDTDSPAFSRLADQYTDSFFRDNVLLLAYLVEGNPADRSVADSVTLDREGRMEINVRRRSVQGDPVMTGRFLAVNVSKKDIAAMVTCQVMTVPETEPPEDFSFKGPFDTYRFEGSEPIDEAVLQLNTERAFILSLSPLSSYMAYGHYNLDGQRLILRTWDGLYTYTFDRHADGWRFNADASSPLYTKLSSLADGGLFRLVEKAPDQEEAGPVHAFLERLFLAIDQQAPFRLPAGMAINEGVSEYVDGKIEAMRVTYQATGSALLDYKIKVRLAETKGLGNDLVSMRFYVDVSYHYENLESVESGYGREIELLIRIDEAEGNTVVGIRVPGYLDGYDAYLYRNTASDRAIELTDAKWVRTRVQEYLQNLTKPGPTPPHTEGREPHHRQTLRDWWNAGHGEALEARSLQIAEYQYDDQSIATKAAFRTIQDRNRVESWLGRLMDLPIREIKAPDSLAGKRSLLELTFQNPAGQKILFISLQTCDDDSNRVFINGSFIPPSETIPENIFLIEDVAAMQMFKDLRSLLEG